MSIVESIDLFHINFALASMKEGRKEEREEEKEEEEEVVVEEEEEMGEYWNYN